MSSGVGIPEQEPQHEPSPAPESGGPVDPSVLGQWRVDHVVETTSTNSDLMAAAEAGSATDRTALMADHQTAGRGRLDRVWEAPSGTNLLVSLLFLEPPVRPSLLTQLVGLAAAEAVRKLAVGAPRASDLGARLGLKWPNDLMLDDAKLAGVLAQRSVRTGAVVVGIGLNVDWAPDGAASLSQNLGLETRPRAVLEALLAEVDRYETASGDLDDHIAAEYVRQLATVGRRVRIELPADRLLIGLATGVDDHGRLVVEGDDGQTHVLDVGDVIHVRPESS